MKKYIPQSARRRVIEKPVLPAAAPVPAGPAMTVVKLPAALAGAENCVAPLICRRTPADSLAHVWLGRTYAFSGVAPESYVGLGVTRGFALHGVMQNVTTLLGPENALPNGILNVELGQVALKLDGVDTVIPEVTDFDALADTTLLFMGREIMSIAAAKLVDGLYTLTVLRSRFGSHDVHMVGDPVWIIQRARLKVFQHPYFAGGNTAKFKIAIGKVPLANAVPFEVKL